SAVPPLVGGEVVKINDQQVVILPSAGQSYQMIWNHKARVGDALYVTRARAYGYTRAQFLDLLRSLGPVTLGGYINQARMFSDPRPPDPDTFAALLQALAPRALPPAGAVRHFVERTYKRHDPRPDALQDPYHVPKYGGRPERLTVENWQRQAASGGLEWS